MSMLAIVRRDVSFNESRSLDEEEKENTPVTHNDTILFPIL